MKYHHEYVIRGFMVQSRHSHNFNFSKSETTLATTSYYYGFTTTYLYPLSLIRRDLSSLSDPSTRTWVLMGERYASCDRSGADRRSRADGNCICSFRKFVTISGRREAVFRVRFVVGTWPVQSAVIRREGCLFHVAVEADELDEDIILERGRD